MSSALAAVPGVAAGLVAGSAVIAALLALAVTRRPALALGILLDLLLAAGLLRLVGDPGWRAIAAVAIIVAIRHLVTYGLRLGARSWVAGRRPPSTGAGVHDVAHRLLRPAWRA